MRELTIIAVGQCKERWLVDALKEYEKRLTASLKLVFRVVKDNTQLEALIPTLKKPSLLDPKGKVVTSEQFSTFLIRELEQGGSRASLIIGGPDGLPDSLRRSGLPMISLSPMTFTQQICRLVLVEQVYRAIQIDEGRPYHR